MNFVIRTVRPHPADVTQCRDLVRRHIVESGNEGVFGHILEEFNAQRAQLRLFGRWQRVFELDQEKAGGRRLGRQPLRLKPRGRGRFGRRGGGDGLIAQPDLPGLAGSAEIQENQTHCEQVAAYSRQTSGLHPATVRSQGTLSKRCGKGRRSSGAP